MLHVTPRTREGQQTKVAKEVCGAESSASMKQTAPRRGKPHNAKLRRNKHNTVRYRRGESIPHHRKSMRPTKERRMQNPRRRRPICIGSTTAP